MKFSRFYFILLSFSPIFLGAAEPSAFGAGDLTSSNPYGLTKNEKVLLETEKKLKTVARKSNSQAGQLDSLRERIDGLQSIIESISRKSHDNKIELQKLKDSDALSNKSIDEYQKRLSLSIQQNSENIDKLTQLTSDLNTTVNQIAGTYVTRSDYNTLVKDLNRFKLLVAKEIKHGVSKKKASSKISNFALAKKAKSDYDRKRYTAAINEYKELIQRKYKPAYAHYMLGEMYFARKHFGKAISYFKKSSILYDKASYMPKLMLHTAISMRKTGDKKHSYVFFNAITLKYPKSREAVQAKKYLAK